jgi:uncharacterized protein YdhG (YjbR/CyaY superfamily)
MSEAETTPATKATAAPTTVTAYVDGFPEGQRAVPGGEEKIRYGMPAVMFTGRYGIHFAGWKKHIGLYPVGELDPDLEAEVAPHRAKKDTVQFFYADGVPYDLIERIARALAARHTG